MRRWLWSVLAMKSLLGWINWWRGSSTVVANPAVRKVPRRGRWCSCIQQTTVWTFRHYLTPSAGLTLTLCRIQIHTPNTATHTATITHCHIHQMLQVGRRRHTGLFVTLCLCACQLLSTSHPLYQSLVSQRHFKWKGTRTHKFMLSTLLCIMWRPTHTHTHRSTMHTRLFAD